MRRPLLEPPHTSHLTPHTSHLTSHLTPNLPLTLTQLDGGADGTFYKELVDYFYYAQLRAQGEETTEPRRITGFVPITELGNMVRSLGFYPSGREVDEMMQEARLKALAAGRDDAASITFDEFIVIYVNHRPIFGVSKEQIADAFAALSSDPAGALSREALVGALGSHDEAIQTDELSQCVRMLIGDDNPTTALGERTDAKTFAEEVLGFQDYAATAA